MYVLLNTARDLYPLKIIYLFSKTIQTKRFNSMTIVYIHVVIAHGCSILHQWNLHGGHLLHINHIAYIKQHKTLVGKVLHCFWCNTCCTKHKVKWSSMSLKPSKSSTQAKESLLSWSSWSSSPSVVRGSRARKFYPSHYRLACSLYLACLQMQ